MGSGSNNIGELMALYYLLKFALDRGERFLQIFGNCLLIIKWISDQAQIQNTSLLVVAEQLKENVRYFQNIMFTHIYREHNQIPDKISKEYLVVMEKHFVLSKFHDGHSIVTRQSHLEVFCSL